MPAAELPGAVVTGDALPPADLDALLATTQAAAAAFLHGDAAPYLAMTSHAEDYTVMGPFGGPATIGYRAYARAAPAIAALFADGTVELKLVAAHASGDLAVLVLDEVQRARIDGGPEQPWSLRVTQVFRREQGEWRVVHRHADPLTRRRTAAEAAALAGGA